MKIREILQEYKILKVNGYRHDNIVSVYKNPSHREILVLLDKYQELRGSVYEDQLVVWNASDVGHYTIDTRLNYVDPVLKLYFSKTRNTQSSEWYGVSLVNGLYFAAKNVFGGTAIATDKSVQLLKRALGIEDVSGYFVKKFS